MGVTIFSLYPHLIPLLADRKLNRMIFRVCRLQLRHQFYILQAAQFSQLILSSYNYSVMSNPIVGGYSETKDTTPDEQQIAEGVRSLSVSLKKTRLLF